MHVYKPPPVGGLDRVPVFIAGTGTTRADLFVLDGVTPMPGNVLVADTSGNLPSFQCETAPVYVGVSGARTTWSPSESGEPTPNAASSVITRTVIPITSATPDRAILLAVPAHSVITAFDLQIVSADTTTRDNMDISFEKDDGTGDEGAFVAYPFAGMDPANPLDPHWASGAFNGTAFLGGVGGITFPAVPVHDTKIRLYRFDTGGVPGDGVYDFIVDWIPSPPA